MKIVSGVLTAILIVFLAENLKAQSYFNNPVITSEVADPSIIKINEKFYATGTSSEWAPFYPMFTSTDLVNWEQIGHVFNQKPDWTSHSFWAPELFYHNNKIFCYYTARRKSDNKSFVGVASSDSPEKEFTDHGPIIEYGTESIDAFVFNDEGQLYISWKAYGLDDRPIELLASKLSEDGLRLEGDVFTLLRDDERIGMEGQLHIKLADYYYIIYAARGCCGPSSDYDVRVARSNSFVGPYVKYDKNPILSGGGGEFQSGGHGTLVNATDNRLFYLFHAYLNGPGFYLGRRPVLQEIQITDDKWIRFTTGDQITSKQLLPFENTKQETWNGFQDNFKNKTLKIEWSWNYPYSHIQTKLKSGKLLLSGDQIGDNKYGTALCVLPKSVNYSYETEIMNKNNSLKGLTMYGDNKNLLFFGVENNKLLLKSIKNDTEILLSEATYSGKSLHLKIVVKDGCILTFYSSSNGKDWERLSDVTEKADYLVRWDRVARPGVIHMGNSEQPAEFSYFKMEKIH